VWLKGVGVLIFMSEEDGGEQWMKDSMIV
jgi:hypothetical protein